MIKTEDLSCLKEADLSDAMAAGLTAEEFGQACTFLNKTPNKLELGIIASMWSEHCSYKSTRVHLARLPSSGPRVLVGPGENAGVMDIGDGMCVVFKVESHNSSFLCLQARAR